MARSEKPLLWFGSEHRSGWPHAANWGKTHLANTPPPPHAPLRHLVARVSGRDDDLMANRRPGTFLARCFASFQN